jgi:CheY-like chemotaxis protein
MSNGGHKVLIVDDEPMALEAMLEVLGALEVSCVGASSGVEALHKFDEGGIGLVITDVRMPGMSGLDLLMQLKDKSPDLPVVLISGYNLDPAELDNATAKADQHLTKPYHISDIVSVLHRFLK